MRDPPTTTQGLNSLLRLWTPVSVQRAAAFRSSTMLSKGEYEIDLDRVLGRGAFGTVHVAVHTADRRKVAAKRIDGKSEEAVTDIANDLMKLCHLSHENIAGVFDVQRSEKTIWVFMELCEQGDLSEYFAGKRDKGEQIQSEEKVNLMLDISKGVEYLHSKNIIHRDIKPSNILLLQRAAKLTDFDCSKFLEEPYNTSLMTTNAGTPAFKAPEFWIRNEKGELNYHRNVDVYAMGLTFLAMIQENKGLVPRIETPNELSELSVPIGLIMWERLRFGTKPLAVVTLKNTAGETLETDDEIRKIISKMTSAHPAERITATQVAQLVRVLAASLRSECAGASRDEYVLPPPVRGAGLVPAPPSPPEVLTAPEVAEAAEPSAGPVAAGPQAGFRSPDGGESRDPDAPLASWAVVVATLSSRFHESCGRPLTDDNLRCLAEKLFGTKQSYSSEIVTWSQFNEDPLPGRKFTFRDWFDSTLDLTRRWCPALQHMWKDGLVRGFASKQRAEEELMECEPGTFLLRFSDSVFGALSVAFTAEDPEKPGEKVVLHLAPFGERDFRARGLADRLRDLTALTLLHRPSPARPVPKDEAFSKFYTSASPMTAARAGGYVGAGVQTLLTAGLGAQSSPAPPLNHDAPVGIGDVTTQRP